MTKYAANAMLATRISFMNQVADLCERVGADVSMVRRGIGSDHRIGPAFLFSGPGYGGSCFPKDVKALIRTAHEMGMELSLLEAVESVNERQKRVLFENFRSAGAESPVRQVGRMGPVVQGGTDDMRESPALSLIDAILEAGASVRAHDPKAMEAARRSTGAALLRPRSLRCWPAPTPW